MQMFDEDGGRYYATVHSLVAHVFIGPRPNGMFIDHIDGNTFNNDISNLGVRHSRRECKTSLRVRQEKDQIMHSMKRMTRCQARGSRKSSQI